MKKTATRDEFLSLPKSERLRKQVLDWNLSPGPGNLEGKLLTIIDSAIVDREQREAVKSLVRETVWEDYREYYWAIVSSFDAYQKSINEFSDEPRATSTTWEDLSQDYK